ncbi:MAG: hypothetical protein K9H49_10140 [Bacteroidales bacterium]|nr:hypothetical protein [Bacteroidales bacterium]MCF8389748.1 hypothetical protein [Bacteroidales bacterium]
MDEDSRTGWTKIQEPEERRFKNRRNEDSRTGGTKAQYPDDLKLTITGWLKTLNK